MLSPKPATSTHEAMIQIERIRTLVLLFSLSFPLVDAAPMKATANQAAIIHLVFVHRKW